MTPLDDAPQDAQPLLTTDQARILARNLSDLFEAASRTFAPNSPKLLEPIERHLGCELDETFLMRARLQPWQGAAATRSFTDYLAEYPAVGEVFNVGPFQHESLAEALSSFAEHQRPKTLGRPTYVDAAVGPDRTEPALSNGAALTTSPSGAPVLLVIRRVDDEGYQRLAMEVLAATREACEETLASMRDRLDRFDVARGQVVSLTASEHFGDARTSFLPRPDVPRDHVILPEETLDRVRNHVLGIGAQSARLTELGLHLKRGVLLHGAPGTGKTHLVRHLVGSTDATVVVLTGSSLMHIASAAALARGLAPSIVVCEDVDLIATDRQFTPDGNAPLFMLLDAIDGIAGDANVCFILTTNRVADLEPALAERPGRVDLAVEIPLPDAAARAALLRLYAGRLDVRADLDAAAEQLEGQTASGMKEIMRRVGVWAIQHDRTVINDADLQAVLDVYLADASAVTRALLGGSNGRDDEPALDDQAMMGGPGDW